MVKVCICFYGVISRSLKKTIESIRNNIFNVLKENNIEYDVYVHNMKVNRLISRRARDSGKIIDCCHLLKPDYFTETNQVIFDKQYNNLIKKVISYGLLKSYFKNTIFNAIRQLYSVKKVTEMWYNSDKEYDFYIYLRPDLLYINKIDIDVILLNLNNNVLLTPSWAKFGGLNDRIYMGKKDIIKYFGFRFDELEKMMEERKLPYHPESYMKYIANKYNIKTVDIELRGKRIRANGKIAD